MLSLPEAHKKLMPDKTLTKAVSIIGLGHLGSWAAINLAKLGLCEFYLYDKDNIEERNISGTPFDRNDVGLSKVTVIGRKIEKEIEHKFVETFDIFIDRYNDIEENSHFFILATDSIESRKEIFDAIISYREIEAAETPIQDAYIIDMRTRADIGEIHIVNLSDKNAIESYALNLEMVSQLHDDNPLSCNESNIITLISTMMGVLTSIIRKLIKDEISIKYAHKFIDSNDLKLENYV